MFGKNPIYRRSTEALLQSELLYAPVQHRHRVEDLPEHRAFLLRGNPPFHSWPRRIPQATDPLCFEALPPVQHILALHQEFDGDLLVGHTLASPQHNICPRLDQRQIWRNSQCFENRTFRGGDYQVFNLSGTTNCR